MLVDAKCTECGHVFEVDRSFLGAARRCPSCQATFQFTEVHGAPSPAETAGEPGEEPSSPADPAADQAPAPAPDPPSLQIDPPDDDWVDIYQPEEGGVVPIGIVIYAMVFAVFGGIVAVLALTEPNLGYFVVGLIYIVIGWRMRLGDKWTFWLILADVILTLLFRFDPSAGLAGLLDATPLLIKIFLIELPILAIAYFNWDDLK